MILLSKTQCRLEERGGVLVVKALVTLLCPVCESLLLAIGCRPRGVKWPCGGSKPIIIRRLRCSNEQCHKIHHELPDTIVPYKRHCAETIEKVITNNTDSVPCESSTIVRIKAWWSAVLSYFTSIFASFTARLGVEHPEHPTFREIIQAAVNSHSWTFPSRLSEVIPRN